MSSDRPSDRVFKDLVDALSNREHCSPSRDEGQVIADSGRAARKGIPEIVFAEKKSIEQLREAVSQLIESTGRAIVSRVAESDLDQLRSAFPDCRVESASGSWTAVVFRFETRPPRTGGRVAIFSAGTSDWPAAHEARVVAEEMGCDVDLVVDVGVAGLHRLFAPLRAAIDRDVDAIVVAAGMDGALPSVIAGLVPVPVIGLPTSIGYGYGGSGQAALMSMLQSCSPGLTVVNIDNAVGAGSFAALIANAAARARAHTPDDLS